MYTHRCVDASASEIPPTGCTTGGDCQAYEPPPRTGSTPRSHQNILSSTRHLQRSCTSTLHAAFMPAWRGRDRSLELASNGSAGQERHPHHVPVSSPVQCRRDMTGWGDEMTIYRIEAGCSSICVSTLNRRDSQETHSGARTETT